MNSSFPASLATIKQHEGGKVDNPKDPGGRTACGVIQRTYDSWRRLKQLPERDVWDICPEEIYTIYRDEFWRAVRGDDLPAGIDLCVFDHSVPSGPSRAIRMMQAQVGALPDGRIGSNTLEKLRDADSARTIDGITERRVKYYHSLPHYATFGKGWHRRASETRRIAHALDGRVSELPALKTGTVGTFVGLAQDMLHIKADKHFGGKTRGAVVGFQSRVELSPDGIIGPNTWGMLFAEYKL